MPFLLRAHGAQNMATIKSCEIYNSLSLHLKGYVILVNEV